jgi:c-di-GMP-binding flagellar brake protein YcgR
MKETKQEHRKFKRFDAYVTVHIYQRDHEKEREILGLSGDLSRDGLKIFTDDTIYVGTILNLVIEIPDDPKPIKASGEVVWCQKNYDNTSAYLLGIHFLNLNAVDRFRVLDYAYNNWLEDKVEEIGSDDPELGFPFKK